jgi:hypothetical protein
MFGANQLRASQDGSQDDDHLLLHAVADRTADEQNEGFFLHE